jgi:hypothetical protein
MQMKQILNSVMIKGATKATHFTFFAKVFSLMVFQSECLKKVAVGVGAF